MDSIRDEVLALLPAIQSRRQAFDSLMREGVKNEDSGEPAEKPAPSEPEGK